MRYNKFIITEDDKAKIQIALSEIKDKVSKIISAIKAGSMTTAAKAVVELTERYGAPFTDELQTQMLVFSKNKDFLDQWRNELSAQQEIWNKLNPTPKQVQAKSKSQEPKKKDKPEPPKPKSGDKQGTVDKPEGPHS
jgi:hypothetical protein